MQLKNNMLNIVDYRNGEARLHCPFHSDSTPSAYINYDKQLFFCHSCHKGLPLKVLYSKFNIDTSELDIITNDVKDLKVIKKRNFDLLSVQAIQYLKNRNLNDNEIDLFKQYNQFAVMSSGSDFIARRYLGTGVRYFKRVDSLFPLTKQSNTSGKLIVVEGLFSMIKLRRLHENTFCLAGSYINNKVQKILASTDHIVIFDNDAAGKDAHRQYKKKFNTFTCNFELDEYDTIFSKNVTIKEILNEIM